MDEEQVLGGLGEAEAQLGEVAGGGEASPRRVAPGEVQQRLGPGGTEVPRVEEHLGRGVPVVVGEEETLLEAAVEDLLGPAAERDPAAVQLERPLAVAQVAERLGQVEGAAGVVGSAGELGLQEVTVPGELVGP